MDLIDLIDLVEMIEWIELKGCYELRLSKDEREQKDSVADSMRKLTSVARSFDWRIDRAIGTR